ncbi:MAG TPA: hypothetical protein VD788_06120 [Candidatus Polarisedimenticolaceae bacterium]|nr:hypothetical protein [Candidatus Polarisedimenticolaceae bacterium]
MRAAIDPRPRRQETFGVVAAIPEEVAPLVARLGPGRRTRDGRTEFIDGRLGARRVVVARTGEGRWNAECGARRLLERFPVSRLLCVGFCGGLSPDLVAGELVIARRLVDPLRPLAAPLAPAIDGARPATLVTVDRMLCTPADKRSAWEAAGGGVATAADMETAAVARVAESRQVPYVALRVVSDAADEALPLDFNRFVDESGRLDRWAIVVRAVRRPSLLPGLFELRGRSRRCAERLADAVCAMIESGGS